MTSCRCRVRLADRDNACQMLDMNLDTPPPEKVGEIKQWLSIIKGDFPQILAILLIAIPLIWLSINFLYKTELDAKDAQLESRDDQIKLLERERDDFKDKTGTSTPDEAKTKITAMEAKIEAFEKRVGALEPRRLTASQYDQIVKNLRLPPPVNYRIAIASDMSCPDCKAYADDFAAAFRTAGWYVSMPSILAPGAIPQTGIGVFASIPSNAGAIAIQALDAANVRYDKLPKYQEENDDVRILITTKSNPFLSR